MNKLASPWIDLGNVWVKQRLISDDTYLSYSHGYPNGIMIRNIISIIMQSDMFYTYNNQIFNILEDAQAYEDKRLIDDGFIFLTQEQWDKYQILI